MNSKGHFNVPIGGYKNPKILDEGNLRNVSKYIERVEFHHSDYRGAKEYLGKRTLVYFDPPYRPLTTSSSFTAYAKSGFNDENQVELAEFCRTLHKQSVSFMLSNSDPKNADVTDDFFDMLYREFKIERVDANRAINAKAAEEEKYQKFLLGTTEGSSDVHPSVSDIPWWE